MFPKPVDSFKVLLLVYSWLTLGVQWQQYEVKARILSAPPPQLRKGCSAELFHQRSHPRFVALCRSQAAVAVAAYEGIQDSMKECREHMYYNPWDCKQINSVLHDAPVLHSGTKEAAYLWALSSAGAAWGIATACGNGWLSDCACDVTVGGKNNYEWGGCLQGVNYGLKIARKILARPSEGSVLRQLEKHNLKVGRIMIRKTLVQDCKCHGVSGSCDQRTCYHRPAHITTIAAHLTKKFHKAKQVPFENPKGKNTELIYVKETPDPCLTTPAPNRVCAWSNQTHHKGDCKRLCCGRQVKKSSELESRQCNCQFQWCCTVQCNTCFSYVTLYTC